MAVPSWRPGRWYGRGEQRTEWSLKGPKDGSSHVFSNISSVSAVVLGLPSASRKCLLERTPPTGFCTFSYLRRAVLAALDRSDLDQLERASAATLRCHVTATQAGFRSSGLLVRNDPGFGGYSRSCRWYNYAMRMKWIYLRTRGRGEDIEPGSSARRPISGCSGAAR